MSNLPSYQLGHGHMRVYWDLHGNKTKNNRSMKSVVMKNRRDNQYENNTANTTQNNYLESIFTSRELYLIFAKLLHNTLSCQLLFTEKSLFRSHITAKYIPES